jgi:hypothetical protein
LGTRNKKEFWERCLVGGGMAIDNELPRKWSVFGNPLRSRMQIRMQVSRLTFSFTNRIDIWLRLWTRNTPKTSFDSGKRVKLLMTIIFIKLFFLREAKNEAWCRRACVRLHDKRRPGRTCEKLDSVSVLNVLSWRLTSTWTMSKSKKSLNAKLMPHFAFGRNSRSYNVPTLLSMHSTRKSHVQR